MRRKNASSDTTRRELLQAGLAQLDEDGFDTTVHVRLTEVTERAGRTTGAAYQLWPRQHHYHHDLALAAVSREPPASARPATTFGAAVEHAVADQLADRRYQAFVHYWAAGLRDPELRDAMRNGFSRYESARRRRFAELLERLELEPKPPRSVDDVTTAVGAIVDGFTFRAGIEPAVDTGLVVAAVRGTIEALTRPVSAG